MFILTQVPNGGVYSVINKDKKKTVQCFEEEDDAVRYIQQLEASSYEKKLEVMEVDDDIVAINSNNHGYYYTVITPNDFVIPPPKE